MFKKFFILNATKDTAIHSYYQDANAGKSFILPLLHNYDGTSIVSKYSRILMDFNFNDAVDFFGGSITSNSFTASLLLTQLDYDEYDHSVNFNIDLFPLTSSWSEGYNYSEDFDEFGYANWNNKSNNQLWGNPGGDYINSLTSTIAFEDGYEDAKLDITRYVQAYIDAKLGLTGGTTGQRYGQIDYQASSDINFSSTSLFNGFLLKFANEGLSSFSEFKRFYSAHTHNLWNPKILIQIDGNSEYDNRNRFIFGKSQNLYFPYRIDGALNSVLSSNVTCSVYKNGVAITSVTAIVSSTNSGLLKSSLTIPQSNYSSTATYTDVWSISGGNSITGRFTAYTESDVVGMNTVSLTGNFNKNYISNSLIQSVGVASQYNKNMHYDSDEFMKFFPYIKKQRGVDNIGLIFNNEMIYPSEFYVKLIDADLNYEWTDWMKLSLINDAYILQLNTKSFRIGARMRPIYKIKIWDSYTVINSTSNDVFNVVRKA